jgi:hypothetical protein
VSDPQFIFPEISKTMKPKTNMNNQNDIGQEPWPKRSLVNNVFQSCIDHFSNKNVIESPIYRD